MLTFKFKDNETGRDSLNDHKADPKSSISMNVNQVEDIARTCSHLSEDTI